MVVVPLLTSSLVGCVNGKDARALTAVEQDERGTVLRQFQEGTHC